MMEGVAVILGENNWFAGGNWSFIAVGGDGSSSHKTSNYQLQTNTIKIQTWPDSMDLTSIKPDDRILLFGIKN